MHKHLLAFILLYSNLSFTQLNGQSNLRLSGSVVSADKKALPGATVYLFKVADSSLVKTALSDSTGNYHFDQLERNNYRLAVSMTGYVNYRSSAFDLQENMIHEPIIMDLATTSLQGVTVTAQRPYIQQKIDRMVINPEALISNAGGTALEVLEKAPGVIVDQNGVITLKNKSVIIFIDDKPTYLTGTDLQNYLRSLNAASIDQIELMTNPPAKYDAAGNGGVINIRTKKIKTNGFNGGLTLNYIQGKYARGNNNLNLNLRAGKLNVFANLNYNHSNSFTDLTINRNFFTSSNDLYRKFVQGSFIRSQGDNLLTKIGADYYISDKTTIGINLSGIYNPSKIVTPVTSRFFNAAGTLDSVIRADNNQHNLFRNAGVNFNLRHQYKKNGPELSADLDYLNYSTNNDQSFDNRSIYFNGSPMGVDLLTGALPASIHIYSGKMDYEYPTTTGLKIGGGIKSSYTHTDNIADYFLTVGGATSPDYAKTNHFVYRENINAGYVNANKEFKRFSFQTGLRLENTISDGHQLGNMQRKDSSFRRTYTSLFPTLYLQYKLDSAGRNTISVNYGRRIDRPFYQDLNPFLSPLDKFTYYTGNPFLLPSFTNNIELAFTYHDRYTASFSYSRSRDNVNETIQILDGIYYSRPGNIGQYTVMEMSLDGSLDPAKWFSIQIHGHAAQIHSVSEFYTGRLDTKGIYYFIRPVIGIKPGKDWLLQVDAGYQSKITNAQFVVQGKGKVNTAVSKKLSTAATVKVVVNDLLYTFRTRGTINNLQATTASWVNKNDSRNFVISLSYRFGKSISNQRKHEANGAESEQNRVKN